MKVSLSYSWRDEEKANVLDKAFDSNSIELIRDVRDLEYKGHLPEFMKEVAHADFIVVLFSDSFMRSPNCMFEILEALNKGDIEKRILPIVCQDLNISNPGARSEYLKYWEHKVKAVETIYREQETLMKSDSILRDIEHYQEIRNNLDSVFQFLLKYLYSTYENLEKEGFETLFNYLKKN